MIIPSLLTALVLIIVTGIVLSNRVQKDIKQIDSELTACELADIMQDESEDAEVKFSINNLINQTLKERNQ